MLEADKLPNIFAVNMNQKDIMKHAFFLHCHRERQSHAVYVPIHLIWIYITHLFGSSVNKAIAFFFLSEREKGREIEKDLMKHYHYMLDINNY